jgi:hypothetical protein
MGPVTTDPDLQQQMIGQMTRHEAMMQSIRNNTGWMNMMYGQMMRQGMMGQGMGMHSCSWCSTASTPSMQYGTTTCPWCPVTNQTMGAGGDDAQSPTHARHDESGLAKPTMEAANE